MVDVHYFSNGELVPASRMDTADFSWETVLGKVLHTANGPTPTDDVLKGVQQVALYFAAAWCPWCRAFDPLLAATVRKVKAANPKDTEVVYISGDTDQEAMTHFLVDKPWVAMPYSAAQGADGQLPLGYVRKKVREDTGKQQGILGAKYKVQSLPFVVVLDGRKGGLTYSRFIVDVGDQPIDGHRFTARAPPSWLEAYDADEPPADTALRQLQVSGGSVLAVTRSKL